MQVKLLLVDEYVIDVVLAMPNSFASSILASCYMELELSQVIHFVVGVVGTGKHFVVCTFHILLVIVHVLLSFV